MGSKAFVDLLDQMYTHQSADVAECVQCTHIYTEVTYLSLLRMDIPCPGLVAELVTGV